MGNLTSRQNHYVIIQITFPSVGPIRVLVTLFPRPIQDPSKDDVFHLVVRILSQAVGQVPGCDYYLCLFLFCHYF
jgi:hypothetical protein